MTESNLTEKVAARKRYRAMDLVLDGADVGADGAEEAQAVASGARIDLQQHPTHRAEFHRPPPAALRRRRASDVSVPRRIDRDFLSGDKNPGLLGLARIVWTDLSGDDIMGR